ncbi:unnamed protein product [Prorocentrum cordatum]|uniref:Uncharacterized protein n=1 Tax=Prorocentrum cordatum TaxID=2364126 RepID=A0ABN9SP18_9DINO|nr:unnamed protein product [Polarella glacialis]
MFEAVPLSISWVFSDATLGRAYFKGGCNVGVSLICLLCLGSVRAPGSLKDLAEREVRLPPMREYFAQTSNHHVCSVVVQRSVSRVCSIIAPSSFSRACSVIAQATSSRVCSAIVQSTFCRVCSIIAQWISLSQPTFLGWGRISEQCGDVIWTKAFSSDFYCEAYEALSDSVVWSSVQNLFDRANRVSKTKTISVKHPRNASVILGLVYKYLDLYLRASFDGLNIEMRRRNERYAFTGELVFMDKQTTIPFLEEPRGGGGFGGMMANFNNVMEDIQSELASLATQMAQAKQAREAADQGPAKGLVQALTAVVRPAAAAAPTDARLVGTAKRLAEFALPDSSATGAPGSADPEVKRLRADLDALTSRVGAQSKDISEIKSVSTENQAVCKETQHIMARPMDKFDRDTADPFFQQQVPLAAHAGVATDLGVQNNAQYKSMKEGYPRDGMPYVTWRESVAKLKGLDQWKKKLVSLGSEAEAVQDLDKGGIGTYVFRFLTADGEISDVALQPVCFLTGFVLVSWRQWIISGLHLLELWIRHIQLLRALVAVKFVAPLAAAAPHGAAAMCGPSTGPRAPAARRAAGGGVQPPADAKEAPAAVGRVAPRGAAARCVPSTGPGPPSARSELCGSARPPADVTEVPAAGGGAGRDPAVDEAVDRDALVGALALVLNRLPRVDSGFDARRVPSIPIWAYLRRVSDHFDCSSACLIASLVYIDRAVKLHSSHLVSARSVHRMLLVSMVLAAKFFDDAHYKNEHYATIGGIDLQELNFLEGRFLRLINWRLHIMDDEYDLYKSHVLLAAKCYP